MILVDSSVWIDFFRGSESAQCSHLDSLLENGESTLVVADLIMMEVLQGFRDDEDFRRARSVLNPLPCFTLGGKRIAIRAAENYRSLRRRGITIRRPIDVLIGTFCIENEIDLLHCDRDFDPLVRHLGLRAV